MFEPSILTLVFFGVILTNKQQRISLLFVRIPSKTVNRYYIYVTFTNTKFYLLPRKYIFHVAHCRINVVLSNKASNPSDISLVTVNFIHPNLTQLGRLRVVHLSFIQTLYHNGDQSVVNANVTTKCLPYLL